MLCRRATTGVWQGAARRLQLALVQKAKALECSPSVLADFDCSIEAADGITVHYNAVKPKGMPPT